MMDQHPTQYAVEKEDYEKSTLYGCRVTSVKGLPKGSLIVFTDTHIAITIEGSDYVSIAPWTDFYKEKKDHKLKAKEYLKGK